MDGVSMKGIKAIRRGTRIDERKLADECSIVYSLLSMSSAEGSAAFVSHGLRTTMKLMHPI